MLRTGNIFSGNILEQTSFYFFSFRIEAEESNRGYKDLLEKYFNKFGNIEENQ